VLLLPWCRTLTYALEPTDGRRHKLGCIRQGLGPVGSINSGGVCVAFVVRVARLFSAARCEWQLCQRTDSTAVDGCFLLPRWVCCFLAGGRDWIFSSPRVAICRRSSELPKPSATTAIRRTPPQFAAVLNYYRSAAGRVLGAGDFRRHLPVWEGLGGIGLISDLGLFACVLVARTAES